MAAQQHQHFMQPAGLECGLYCLRNMSQRANITHQDALVVAMSLAFKAYMEEVPGVIYAEPPTTRRAYDNGQQRFSCSALNTRMLNSVRDNFLNEFMNPSGPEVGNYSFDLMSHCILHIMRAPGVLVYSDTGGVDIANESYDALVQRAAGEQWFPQNAAAGRVTLLASLRISNGDDADTIEHYVCARRMLDGSYVLHDSLTADSIDNIAGAVSFQQQVGDNIAAGGNYGLHSIARIAVVGEAQNQIPTAHLIQGY